MADSPYAKINFTKGKGEQMKAFLILEDGTVFTGTSIGSTKDMISEIVFNTSMTGYLEVLTDPSYAGQAVVMTYPLIGNYGITPDMESRKAWPDGYIVRELSRMPSNFRCEGTIQDFLKEQDIPGIAGVDTRALTKILREKGTMNGMITTNENYNLDEILPKLKAYTVGEILRLTEGNLAPVACLAGAENRCELCGECSTLDFWAGLYATVNEYLDRYTLADLLKERQRKLKKSKLS